jgi:ubiquinone/menaquinone biosynthesis C-methylase UbiE
MASPNESDNAQATPGVPTHVDQRDPHGPRVRRIVAAVVHKLVGVNPIMVQHAVRTLQHQLSDARSELEHVRKSSTRSADALEGRIKELDEIVLGRGPALDENNAPVPSLNQRLADIQKTLNECRQRFTAIEGRLKNIADHFDGDDKRIRANSERIAEVEKYTATARQRFTDNERRFESIAERLDGFEARHGYSRSRMDVLESVLQSANDNPDALWLFAHRDERMDATSPLFNEGRRNFHLARYEFAAPHVKGQRVADIACGLGYGTAMLARSGAKSVAGVDIDASAIAYANRHHHDAGVEFLCGSAENLPLPDASVDVVASFETIEHVPDDAALVGEFARVLRPGGRLICSTPNQWPLEVAPYHVREYNLESFRATLEPHFVIAEMYNQNSGMNSQFNHGQPAGIVETTPENAGLAECYIAVCTKR